MFVVDGLLIMHGLQTL